MSALRIVKNQSYQDFSDKLGLEARLYLPVNRSVYVGDRNPWYLMFPHMVFARIPNHNGVVLGTVFADASLSHFYSVPLVNVSASSIVCLASGSKRHYTHPERTTLSDLVTAFWSARFAGVMKMGWRNLKSPEEVIAWLRSDRDRSFGPYSTGDIQFMMDAGAHTYVW